MKKVLAGLLFFLLYGNSKAQTTASDESGIRPASFGFSFIVNDFNTPSRIRSTSLTSVLANDRWAGLKETAPGIAISYNKGLRRLIDLSVTLGISSGEIFLEGKSNSRGGTLLEGDASVHFKLLPENFMVKPFASVGIGGSIYSGYYGAILPLGAGFRISLSDETSLILSSQYRIGVTETAGYHFTHGLGIQARL